MRVRHILLATAAALVLVGSALAAGPTKNGLYIGKLTGRGLEKRVELHVSKSGKTATAALYCSNTLSGKLKPFPIKNGFKSTSCSMLLVAAATMAVVAGTTEAASARPENSVRPGTFARGLPLDRTLSFVRPEELNFVFPSDGVNAQPWKEDGPIRFFRRDHGFVRGHLVSYRRDVQLPAEYVFSVRSYVGLYRKAAQAKWELRHAAELYFPHRTVEISEPPKAYVGDQTVELKTTEAAHSTAIVFRRGRYTAAVLAAGAQTFPELSAVETLAGFVDDRIRGHL